MIHWLSKNCTDSAEDGDVLVMGLIERDNDLGVGTLPSTSRRRPDIEGGLVGIDEGVDRKLSKPTSEVRPLNHQLGLVAVGQSGDLLGFVISDAVALVELSQGTGMHFNVVALPNDGDPSSQWQATHLVEALVGAELLFEVGGDIEEAPGQTILEAVAVLVKSVDDPDGGGNRNSSGTRNLTVTCNDLVELGDRAVAAVQEVHYLLFVEVSPVYPLDRFSRGEAADGRIGIFFVGAGVFRRHRTNLLH